MGIIAGGWQKSDEGGLQGGMTHGGDHCSIPEHPIKTTEEQRERKREDIYRESETLTEKSSGTRKSKPNPFHNLPY